jgi:hypothetical protein
MHQRNTDSASAIQSKPAPIKPTGPTTLKRGNQDQPGFKASYGAGNGGRTRDTKLGKLVLYQLSYARATFLIHMMYQVKDTSVIQKK